MKKFRILATGLLMAGASSGAVANCADVLAYVASNPSWLAYYQLNYPQCFPSASPGASQQLSATSFQQVSAISSLLGSRLLGAGGPPGGAQRQAGAGQTGMAAGAPADRWNAWTNVSHNINRYDATTGAVRSMSGIDVTNLVVGGDYRFSPALVGGISAAFDRSTGSVGVAPVSATTTGYAIAPYLGWQLSEKLAVDAALGFGEAENSTGTGRTDQRRLFAAGNVTYADWYGNWQVSGKAGYLWAQEKSSDLRANGAVIANSAATARLGQARIGVEAGYWMGNGMMPFLGLSYSSDILRAVQGNASWDRDAFLLSAGLNFFSLKDKITGGIVYSQESGRRNTSNSTLMGNVNIRF